MKIITDDQIKEITKDGEIRDILSQINSSKIPDEIKQVIYLNIQRIAKDEINEILSSYLFEMENSKKEGFMSMFNIFKSEKKETPDVKILLNRLERVFN